MRPTSWTDRHHRLVVDAAPPVPEPDATELDRLWSQVAGAIEADRAPRRRRRIRVGIAAGIGAVVLGTSGLAAADLYTARTGSGPVDAEDLRLGGPGEKLQLNAPDYGEVVAEETADIPFPSTEAREFAVADQVHDARFAQNDEFVSSGAVRAWVANAALCSWSNQWAAATRDGDEAGRAEAIDMIQAAPSWPAVVAIDPEPYSRMETSEVTDGKGHTRTVRSRDNSHFFYLAALGEVAEGRDLAAVARVLAENNGYCRPGNVPDLPAADSMYGQR
jgi:hypothetical protein